MAKIEIPEKLQKVLAGAGLLLTAVGVVRSFGPVIEPREWLENVIAVYDAALAVAFWPLTLLSLEFPPLSRTVMTIAVVFGLSCRAYRRMLLAFLWNDEHRWLRLGMDAIIVVLVGTYIRQVLHGQTARNSDPWAIVFGEGIVVGIAFFFVVRLGTLCIDWARAPRTEETAAFRQAARLAVVDYLVNLAIVAVIAGAILVAGAQLFFEF